MGCWLQSKTGNLVVRDFLGEPKDRKGKPMKRVGTVEPTWFENLHPSAFLMDADLFVVADKPPPAKETPKPEPKVEPKKFDAPRGVK